jgi:hypothetical protein
MNDRDESIAADRLRGVRQIAAELDETIRRTYYLLENGLIPAGKQGGNWIGSRRALREHYERLTGSAA